MRHLIFFLLALYFLVFVSCSYKNATFEAKPQPIRQDQAESTQPPEKMGEWEKLFREQQFQEFEKRITSLLKDKQKHELELHRSYAEIGNLGESKDAEPIILLLNNWCNKSPHSHIPFTAMGAFYIGYAWNARGGGWANTVTKEGWKLFYERLNLSKHDLEKAYQLNPQDPNAAGFMLIVGRGLGFTRSDMEKWFKRALTADPNNFFAYKQKLEYLKPKWHGSEEEVTKFFTECSLDSPAVFLRIDAYEDTFNKVWWENKRNNRDLRNIYYDSKALENIYKQMKIYLKYHPDSILALTYFAKIACLARDYPLAYELFTKTEVTWIKECWHTKRYFDGWKNTVTASQGRPYHPYEK